MPNIIDFYTADAWKEAGESLADHTRMAEGYKTGLLHLVYYLLYTETGRTYMHTWIPSKRGYTEADVRAELKRKFLDEFNVDGAAQEAMIAAHLAGFAWVAAQNAGDTAERDKQEAIFKQNLSAVSWALWEEGSGPLFPLGW